MATYSDNGPDRKQMMMNNTAPLHRYISAVSALMNPELEEGCSTYYLLGDGHIDD